MSRSVSDSKAKGAAKLYLEMRRYSIIEQNWQRSKQQIDIVAKKDEVIYLVSVYYHPDNTQASSRIQALTTSKLQQLHSAADSWAIEEKWSGKYELASVEIGDPNFAVISFTDKLF
jgi:Holliday junction resolvase-like predicted endonuclease